MSLTTEEKLDLVRRVRLIDAEMESLTDFGQVHQIFRAEALNQERTSLRQQLVDDLLA